MLNEQPSKALPVEEISAPTAIHVPLVEVNSTTLLALSQVPSPLPMYVCMYVCMYVRTSIYTTEMGTRFDSVMASPAGSTSITAGMSTFGHLKIGDGLECIVEWG